MLLFVRIRVKAGDCDITMGLMEKDPLFRPTPYSSAHASTLGPQSPPLAPDWRTSGHRGRAALSALPGCRDPTFSRVGRDQRTSNRRHAAGSEATGSLGPDQLTRTSGAAPCRYRVGRLIIQQSRIAVMLTD